MPTSVTPSASTTTRAGAVALALLAAASGALARDDDRKEDVARRDKEATALFATIIEDIADGRRNREGALFDTCEIDAAWSKVGIDYEIAHKAVGLEVHANITTPYGVAAVSTILGARVPKGAICDEAKRTRDYKSRTLAWQAAFRAMPSGSEPPEAPYLNITQFSYPLFDRDYRRAVLVYEHDGHGPFRTVDDKPMPSFRVFGGGVALVYARTGDTWHRAKKIGLFGTP